MRQDNVFLVGPPLPAENIIGYRSIRRTLRTWAYGPSSGISLHGMHRTGKTSLAREQCRNISNDAAAKIAAVYVNMANVTADEGKSWYDTLLGCMIGTLERELSKKILPAQIPGLEAALKNFRDAPTGNDYRDCFRWVFVVAKEAGWKTRIVLDEFDRAAEPDGFQTKADYELFRSLSGPDTEVGLMLISRRELYLIEKVNTNNSVFNGAFKKYSLPGFQETDGSGDGRIHRDMTDYYKALKEYDIQLTQEEKEELQYFTGWNPYLLSIFGFELADAAVNDLPRPTMRQIYVRSITMFRDYMDTVYSRLDGDARLKGETSYAQKLVGIVIGPMIGVTQEDVELFDALGYLRRIGTGEREYQCVSGVFTRYLANKRIQSDAWTELMELDGTLRLLIERELDPPADHLTQDQWFAVLADVFLRADQQPNFSSKNYLRDIKVNEDTYHTTLPVLQVISMKDCFRILRAYWQENFSRYFDNDLLSAWEEQFEICGAARNPYAHNTAKLVMTAEQQAQIRGYCVKITSKIKENFNLYEPNGLPQTAKRNVLDHSGLASGV